MARKNLYGAALRSANQARQRRATADASTANAYQTANGGSMSKADIEGYSTKPASDSVKRIVNANGGRNVKKTSPNGTGSVRDAWYREIRAALGMSAG